MRTETKSRRSRKRTNKILVRRHGIKFGFLVESSTRKDHPDVSIKDATYLNLRIAHVSGIRTVGRPQAQKCILDRKTESIQKLLVKESVASCFGVRIYGKKEARE